MAVSEQDPNRRADWREVLDEDDSASLVVVDESGTNLAMTPRNGPAPRGERVVGTATRTHDSKTPLVAALSLDGISAAMTVEGAMDRLAFDVFVDRILVPRRRPGQIVVWDTHNAHTSDDAQRAIAACSCQVLWHPPTSPDLTPIEQAFSTRKTALRRTAARMRAALDVAITDGRATITATDACGWFAHSGYPIPSQRI